MRTMCSREIFTKKCRQQQIFDSDLKGAWHCNHVTFTPIAKNFMLFCRLIYMLSILCVRLTVKVKVGIPESFKVAWYPPQKKKLGRVTLTSLVESPFLVWSVLIKCNVMDKKPFSLLWHSYLFVDSFIFIYLLLLLLLLFFLVSYFCLELEQISSTFLSLSSD